MLRIASLTLLGPGFGRSAVASAAKEWEGFPVDYRSEEGRLFVRLAAVSSGGRVEA